VSKLLILTSEARHHWEIKDYPEKPLAQHQWCERPKVARNAHRADPVRLPPENAACALLTASNLQAPSGPRPDQCRKRRSSLVPMASDVDGSRP
jgi:hypothetical protein